MRAYYCLQIAQHRQNEVIYGEIHVTIVSQFSRDLPTIFFSAPFASHRSSMNLCKSPTFRGRLSLFGSKNRRNILHAFDDSNLNSFGVRFIGIIMEAPCQAVYL